MALPFACVAWPPLGEARWLPLLAGRRSKVHSANGFLCLSPLLMTTFRLGPRLRALRGERVRARARESRLL